MSRFITHPTPPRGPAGKALNDNFDVLDAAFTQCTDETVALLAASQTVSSRAEDARDDMSAAADTIDGAERSLSAAQSRAAVIADGVVAADAAIDAVISNLDSCVRAIRDRPTYRMPADYTIYRDETRTVLELSSGFRLSFSEARDAIATAIDNVFSSGGSVYIKAGTYILSGPIVYAGAYSKGDVLIHGDRDAVLKLVGTAQNDAILFLHPRELNNIVIRDITFDGGYTGSDRVAVGLFQAYYCNNISFKNVTFRNAKGYGIFFAIQHNATPYVRVRNVIIEDCVFDTIALSPINAGFVDNLIVRNCRFRNTCRNPYATGVSPLGDVYAVSSSNVSSAGNIHRTGGVNMAPQNYNMGASHIRDSYAAVVRACVSDDHRSQGFLISQTPCTAVCDNTITRTVDNNTGRYRGYQAIYMESSKYCVVSGNVITGSPGALSISSETLVDAEGRRRPFPSDNCIVRGNVFHDVESAAAVAGSRCVFAGNVFRSVGYRNTYAGEVESAGGNTVVVLLPPIAGEASSLCGFGYYQWDDVCDMCWMSGNTRLYRRGMVVPANGCQTFTRDGNAYWSRVTLVGGSGSMPPVGASVELSNRQRSTALMILSNRVLVHNNTMTFPWPFGSEEFVNCNHVSNKLNYGNFGTHIKYSGNEFLRIQDGQHVFQLDRVVFGTPQRPHENSFVNNRPNP